MESLEQKRIVSGSPRAIITRSRAAASLKVDFAEFAFAKRKADSPVKMPNKKPVLEDRTNREPENELGYMDHNDLQINAAAKKLAKTKIGERNTKAAKVPQKLKTNKTTSRTVDNAIASYFRIVKNQKVLPPSQTTKKENFKIRSGNIQSFCVPAKAQSKQKKTTTKSDVTLADPVVQIEHAKETQQKQQMRFSSGSDSSPSLSSCSADLNQQIQETPLVDSTIPPKRLLPPGVEDFDAENWTDPYQVSNYATDIFNYFKDQEEKFQIKDYMPSQTSIKSSMRAVAVDWMVEVQENFELNHETLYLAVKLMDSYLSKVRINKEHLQLVAITSLYVASKYDERYPPSVEDHVHIGEGYDVKQLLAMEISILKKIDFNLGFPISYSFLRRYARFGRICMSELTLARYILEYSLLDYSFLSDSDSKLAAAALLLALQMKCRDWTPSLQYASGYSLEDLKTTAVRLNRMLHKVTISGSKLVSVMNKYSHKIFYEVAKLPLLDKLSFQ